MAQVLVWPTPFSSQEAHESIGTQPTPFSSQEDAQSEPLPSQADANTGSVDGMFGSMPSQTVGSDSDDESCWSMPHLLAEEVDVESLIGLDAEEDDSSDAEDLEASSGADGDLHEMNTMLAQRMHKHSKRKARRCSLVDGPFAADTPKGAELARHLDAFHSWDIERQNQWLWDALRTMPPKEWLLLGERVASLREYCKLLGVAECRVRRLLLHQREGQFAPPMDGRKASTRQYACGSMDKAHMFFAFAYEHLAEFLAEADDFLDSEAATTIFHSGSPMAAQGPRDVLPVAAICNLSSDPKDLPPKYMGPGTTAELYDQYLEFWTDLGNEQKPASSQVFYRAFMEWRKVLLRRSEGTHKTCSDCQRYAEWRKRVSSEAEKQEVRRALHQHLKIMRMDRRSYKLASVKSEMCLKAGSQGTVDPIESICTMCLDGMGQVQTLCPRHKTWCRSKESEKSWRPNLHLSGGIVHGCTEHFFRRC